MAPCSCFLELDGDLRSGTLISGPILWNLSKSSPVFKVLLAAVHITASVGVPPVGQQVSHPSLPELEMHPSPHLWKHSVLINPCTPGQYWESKSWCFLNCLPSHSSIVLENSSSFCWDGWSTLIFLSSSRWVTSLSFFTFMHWRRKWQPTPVFLPGESQGQVSLVGCCLWGGTESDTTEVT